MINNYSYAPHMLDENTTVLYYENDDMYIEVTKEREYSGYIFRVYACSYDGQLEYFYNTESEEEAAAIYNYIVENYATTPPAGDISQEIDAYIKKTA